MKTYEFRCRCGVEFRFQCRCVKGGRIAEMGCMEPFSIPGEVVQMFAKNNGKWVELYCDSQELVKTRNHEALPVG